MRLLDHYDGLRQWLGDQIVVVVYIAALPVTNAGPLTTIPTSSFTSHPESCPFHHHYDSLLRPYWMDMDTRVIVATKRSDHADMPSKPHVSYQRSKREYAYPFCTMSKISGNINSGNCIRERQPEQSNRLVVMSWSRCCATDKRVQALSYVRYCLRKLLTTTVHLRLHSDGYGTRRDDNPSFRPSETCSCFR